MEQARRTSYDCPHCRRALQAEPGSWRGWLLCPHCGIPAMPPHAGTRPARHLQRPRARSAPVSGSFVTKAKEENEPARPEFQGAMIALAATSLVLVALGFLEQVKAESIAMAILLMLLIGLLSIVHNRRK